MSTIIWLVIIGVVLYLLIKYTDDIPKKEHSDESTITQVLWYYISRGFLIIMAIIIILGGLSPGT